MLSAVMLRGLALTGAIALSGAPLLAQDLTPGELRALTYYVEQGDTRAAEAEMARLRRVHPDWTPPPDLRSLVAPARPTEPGDAADRVWKLIEIGNLEAARGRLDDLRASYPDWTPPEEMLRLLTLAEAQRDFERAAEAGDAPRAIAVARGAPGLLRCDRVNNAWQLASMQIRAGQEAEALGTYRGVLGSCTDPDILVATLQKAGDIANVAQLRALADHARTARPEAAAPLTRVEAELLAGKGVATAAPPQKISRATSAPEPRGSRRPARAAPPPAPARPPSAAAGRTVAAGGMPDTGDGRVAAVRRAARAGAWARCLDASANPRSVDVLYERGWCAYNRDRSLEALAAFRVAATSGLGKQVRRDARYGMILAYLANRMTEDAARLTATTDLTRKQRLDVESVILDQRGVRAFQQKRYAESVAFFDALERLTGTMRRDLAIMRAYAYLNKGDRITARAHFRALHKQLATPETRRGLRATSG